jgi:ABC-2 type transport system ATP-binding protein
VSEHPVWLSDVRKVFPSKGKAGSAQQGFAAVDGVTFEISEGEIFGLLGPNGAGKTTTIKMISTLLRPTSGLIHVAGVDVVRSPNLALRHLGTVLTGERSVYWKLTGRENLEYFAALYGIPARAARARIDGLLERFSLTPRANERVERYSTGMRQRICLAKALLAEPQILMLDEPTAGLDPQAARNMRELILENKSQGRTVLLTTHYMEEADQLCDRVAIIDHGKIIVLDSPAELKGLLKDRQVINVELGNWEEPWRGELVASGASGIDVHFDDEARLYRLSVHLNGRLSTGETVSRLIDMGAQLQNLTLSSPSLEDVFIHLTGKSLRE